MAEKEKYGLIAGNGRFPFLVLQSAREQSIDVVVAAIKEETFPEIETCGFPVHWLGLGELGKLIRVFRNSGVQKAIMAGQVKHVQIFGSSFPDLTMIRMLAGLKQKNTDALIGGVARVLEESGISLVDSTILLKPHLAVRGLPDTRGISALGEVRCGLWPADRSPDRFDGYRPDHRSPRSGGRGCGSDGRHRRGHLTGLANWSSRKNLTVIKVSKPKQDMRFDIPVVGLSTLETMIASGATALVIDAGRTLVFDRDKFKKQPIRTILRWRHSTFALTIDDRRLKGRILVLQSLIYSGAADGQNPGWSSGSGRFRTTPR